MFSLRARCPVDPRSQAWLETGMVRLARGIGIERLANAAVVVPDAAGFPELFAGTGASTRAIVERAAAHVGVPAARVTLESDDEGDGGEELVVERGTAGSTIRLRGGVVRAPHLLLATLYRELAHALLVDRGLADEQRDDHGALIELLLVYLGVAISAANTNLLESGGVVHVLGASQSAVEGPESRSGLSSLMHAFGGQYGWQLSRHGELSSDEYGYALALFCHYRGEDGAGWKGALRDDVLAAWARGLRYLAREGGCRFRPDRLAAALEPPTPARLQEALTTPRLADRIAAMWSLERAVESGARPVPSALDALEAATRAKEVELRLTAAETLAALGRHAEPKLDAIAHLVVDFGPRVRAAAVEALSGAASSSAEIVPVLQPLLGDSVPAVVEQVCVALARLGRASEPVTPDLVAVAARSYVAEEPELADVALRAACLASDDPRAAARRLEPSLDRLAGDWIARRLAELLDELAARSAAAPGAP